MSPIPRDHLLLLLQGASSILGLRMEKAFDIEAARRNYRRRQAQRKTTLLERWQQARREADAAVQIVIDHYRPERIIQWGSILRPDRFTEMSDIDIAVEGVTDPETWSKMERELLDCVSFSLDLVPFEKLRTEHKSDILKRGIVVYERE